MSTTTASSDQELRRVAEESARDEITDHTVYSKLAESYRTKNPTFAGALTNLAAAELRHYDFWRKYTDGASIRANAMRVRLVLFLRLILGTSFAVKYLEKDEGRVIQAYKSVEDIIPAEDRVAFDSMLRDEMEHENMFAGQVTSSAVKYISFIILGLADAVVEISAIHAGSLGLYDRTEVTGLAGIVAGAAASISMASAAYAQAKQGFHGRASVSALFTGISYFVNAIVLALPYFLTSNKFVALPVSLALAIVIVAFINYYNSVVSGGSFLKDFGELTGIMLGATAALYAFGQIIASVFGVPTL